MQCLLSNIRKVEYASANNLVKLFILPHDRILLGSGINFKEIPLIGLASCEISDKIVKNTKIYSIKLQFHCCDKFVEPLSTFFQLTTVDGRRYILGAAWRPFPVVQNDESMPSSPTGKSGTVVTITLDSLYPLLSVC